MNQDQLNDMSHSLSRLELDDMLVVCINAIIMSSNDDPVSILKRISTVMVSAAALLNDDVKIRTVAMLRAAANQFEDAVERLRGPRLLN